VESVSWEDAAAFCRELSALPQERRAGRVYRLPTEAEWEYGWRGGATSSTPFQVGTSLCSAQANFHGDYPYGGAAKGPWLGRPCAVGSYPPNAWGLFDLHGNVWEWCQNRFFTDKRDPQKEDKVDGRSSRSLRGGAFLVSNALYLRSVGRNGGQPAFRNLFDGFRPARTFR